MRRKISLAVWFAFTLTISTMYYGCTGSNESEFEEQNVTVNFNINEPKIKEKLGDDDGYAFAIHYGSDIHGSLETCG
ncbi:MAG: hypothetical protein AB1757_19505 [Acidobacteriota bacterium]